MVGDGAVVGVVCWCCENCVGVVGVVTVVNDVGTPFGVGLELLSGRCC